MATADNVIISVQNLCKYFKKDAIRALDGISVDIRQGDVIAAIGPSGSGKSTVLRSLNLLETPTSGSILFHGVDITQKKVNIALVGKYTELPDAYKSIVESFIHAGAANHTKVKLQYVNSEKITKENIAA